MNTMFRRISIASVFAQRCKRTFCTKKILPNTITCKYKPERFQTEAEKETDMYLCVFFILGGFLGATKKGSEAYAETKQDEYFKCVHETTLMTMAGFIGGMVGTIMLPVIVPIGTVVAVARYFETPEPPINSDGNYCVYPRLPR